jgi:hypothetical protein
MMRSLFNSQKCRHTFANWYKSKKESALWADSFLVKHPDFLKIFEKVSVD